LKNTYSRAHIIIRSVRWLWWCIWFFCLTLVLWLFSMDLILRNSHTTHLSPAGSSKWTHSQLKKRAVAP